ncbi:hypothetical protein [Streptomyces sp. NPDC020983]|uniref:hypothetical protein n=1 Tax=Streptomyces sp. NPDC020983 TaxID=3365106 RepID=UPI0037918412
MSNFAAEATGSSGEAEGWVRDSPLDGAEKELLLAFVRRFPGLGFTRDAGARAGRAAEQKEGVRLPPWLHGIRQVLCSAAPDVQVRFDDFDSYTPRADYLEEIWYSIGLVSMGEEQRHLFVEEAGVFPVGEWEESNRSFLAVNLRDVGDTQVLEFSAPDLMDNISEGKPANVSVHPAFRSYASMLSHVTACRTADGAVVEAQ